MENTERSKRQEFARTAFRLQPKATLAGVLQAVQQVFGKGLRKDDIAALKEEVVASQKPTESDAEIEALINIDAKPVASATLEEAVAKLEEVATLNTQPILFEDRVTVVRDLRYRGASGKVIKFGTSKQTGLAAVLVKTDSGSTFWTDLAAVDKLQ